MSALKSECCDFKALILKHRIDRPLFANLNTDIHGVTCQSWRVRSEHDFICGSSFKALLTSSPHDYCQIIVVKTSCIWPDLLQDI